MSTDAMAVAVPDEGPVGLNSPPDSNPALGDGGSDSELSDLEPEIDNTAPLVIQPSYYSDGGVPVFEPTMDEFSNFQRYIDAVNPYGMRTGIVKVIPPAEWVANQPRLDEAIKSIQIKNPISQEIAGGNGIYRQANMEKGRSYNLPQWRELCEKSEHQPPAKRGERRVNQTQAVKPTPKTKPTAGKAKAAGAKRTTGRMTKAKSGPSNSSKNGDTTPDRLPTPVSPSTRDQDGHESVKVEEEAPAPFRRMGGRQPKATSVSARRKNNQAAMTQIDEAAFDGFKYELEDKFPQERCDELERQYWKTLTFAPPLYGGDMPGTLFNDRTTTWNLSNLPNLLNVLGQKIPGVNTAYLYLGMWKATFAWHLEDVDLYSINYLHFGAPKQWYSISQGDARKFERAMASNWPIEARKCDQFLRHKTYLISPSTLLSQYGIKANKIVHHPGEFVITFPYGYHSGYNLGYNCAEAVNFAVESWLEHARVAKRCDCADAEDSVWVDYHEIERKLRGEDTEFEETDEEEDEEDEVEVETSGLPSPPDSNGAPKLKAAPKKRKRPLTDKGNKPNVKKIRVRIKAPSKEPCILCPNDIPAEPLLSTEDGQKVHRICAQYIPETRIEPGEQEIVMDLEHIPKARHDLKCNFCRSKKGACFQCSQKKCARAYHATCAAAAGVFVEQGEVPHFGEDGTEYKRLDFGFSCRFHRAKRDKKLDADALGDDERIMRTAAELEVGAICQLQFYKGDIFAGAVVENRTSEQTLLVDIVPRGERIEVEYKWLLLPDASDYHLPKASANAVPMPKSFKDREMLNTTERQVDDLPRADDPFVKGTTWAEFKNEPIPRNLAQVKVDFKKENQLWYYLGKTSTEAKAQFTEDPAKPVHNPKGHFLDTIPKPMPTVPRQSYAASYPSNLSQPPLSSQKSAMRPPQPAMFTPSSSKPEKPYQYKPRAQGGEAYRVDPQAFRSQHIFVQRSAQGPSPSPAPTSNQAPYGLNFNTDPKFQPTARQSNPYPSQSTAQTPPMGPLAPPASYRPPQPLPAPTRAPNTSNSNTIFGAKKTNPFAKYPYLQKEHNRSPSEYKSPYRLGGGFMNGYQGTKEQIEAAFRQQIFGPTTGTRNPNDPIVPPTRAYDQTMIHAEPSRMSPGQVSGPAYSPRAPLSYSQSSTPTPMPTPPNNHSTWQKKDGSNLHPAIRPEYTMFHNQYQPIQRPLVSQQENKAIQASATYNRQAMSPQSIYQIGQPQGQTLSEGRSPPIKNGSSVESSGTIHPTPTQLQMAQSNAHRPTSQHSGQLFTNGARQYNVQAPYQSHQQYITTSQTTGGPSFSPQVDGQHSSSIPVTSQQQHMPTPPKTPAIAQVPVNYSQVQTTHLGYQDNKIMYPHQQSVQNWNVEPHTSKAQSGSPRDFPDVPADSTSIIEKLMKNLRKASSSHQMAQTQHE